MPKWNKMEWHKCQMLNNGKLCKNPNHKYHRRSWLGGFYWSNGKIREDW